MKAFAQLIGKLLEGICVAILAIMSMLCCAMALIAALVLLKKCLAICSFG